MYETKNPPYNVSETISGHRTYNNIGARILSLLSLVLFFNENKNIKLSDPSNIFPGLSQLGSEVCVSNLLKTGRLEWRWYGTFCYLDKTQKYHF